MRKGFAAFALLWLACACIRAQADSTDFQWGVNGHPCLQDAYYAVPIEKQLDLMAELGLHWYRTDWPSDTVKRTPEVYDKLIAAAARRKIHILPILFPPVDCRSKSTPEQIQEASFEYAKAVAHRFRGRITHWELDNELDNFTILRKGDKNRLGVVWQGGDPSGDNPEDFEETRYHKAAAELQGLSEGIKAGDPHAKTLIDAGWLHFGYTDRLIKEDKVPFDILAWHWYSDMGDITRVNGHFNLLERLRGYGKRIWITESGWRGDLKPENQADWIRTTAAQFRSLPDVDAFFLYELLDEPALNADVSEQHYGLVTLSKNTTGKWQFEAKKAGFYALQNVTHSMAGP
jgi:hypothetical protein